MQQKQILEIFKQKKSINEIYKGNINYIEDRHTSRYDDLRKRFGISYGMEPSHYVRVSGLMGIIGDINNVTNLDQIYVGSDQEILIALQFEKTDKKQEDKKIIINNCQGSLGKIELELDFRQKFREQAVENQFSLDENHYYYNLVLCGYKSAFLNNEVDMKNLSEMKILIMDNIPRKSEMASSSALIIAICISTLLANSLEKKINIEQLIVNIEKYEKMINVDNYKANQVRRIFHLKRDFFMYVTKTQNGNEEYSYLDANLFNKYSILFADSLTPKPVIMTRGQYIQKIKVEVRIGLIILLVQQGYEKLVSKIKTFKDLILLNELEIKDLKQLVNENIKDDQYLIKELKDNYELIIEMKLEDLLSDIKYSNVVMNENQTLNIKQSMLHFVELQEQTQMVRDLIIQNEENVEVLFECFRNTFNSCMNRINNGSKQIAQLNSLLNQLQVNTVFMPFEGFGGSILAFLDSNKVPLVVKTLMNDYYNNKDYKLLVGDDLNMYINETKAPTQSIVILDPSSEIWF